MKIIDVARDQQGKLLLLVVVVVVVAWCAVCASIEYGASDASSNSQLVSLPETCQMFVPLSIRTNCYPDVRITITLQYQ